MSECEKMTVRIYSDGPDAPRIAVADGKAWFSIDDVCRVLRVYPEEFFERLEDDEFFFIDDENDSTRATDCFISESGLWKAYLESGTQEARCFQRWLFREHLPELMKRQLGLS